MRVARILPSRDGAPMAMGWTWYKLAVSTEADDPLPGKVGRGEHL